MKRYRRLARYSLRQWRPLVVLLVSTVSFSAIIALQPLPMKLLVDYALGDTAVPSAVRSVLRMFSVTPTPTALVVSAALATIILFVLNSVLTVATTWAWTAAGQRMVYDLAGDLFVKLQRLSLLFHARRHVGDSLSRLSGDTYSVYSLTEAFVVSPVAQVGTMSMVGFSAWRLHPGLTLTMLGMGPVMAISARFFGARLQARARTQREAQTRVLAFVQQTYSAMPVVQAFDTSTRNTATFGRLTDGAVGAIQRSQLTTLTFNQVTSLIGIIGTAVITFLGAVRVIEGSLSLGSLLVFIAYLRSVQNSSKSLLTSYGQARSAAASADRVIEILDSDEQVVELPRARRLSRRPTGAVKLEAVTFGYSPGSPAVRDISLAAEPGEVVALVGPTGAGKSTIISLIPRFFDPWEGRVTLDGADLRELTLASVRSNVALVLQEPFLLPLSIAENIGYGSPGASRSEVEAAAIAAQADGFICQLPDGYDTVIGERGGTLSGGERQRLSIARALLKDAPVLVLDEPSSALDSLTETALMQAIEKLMERRTTFIIAHRLSTVQRADRIAVIDGGRLVEVGTHTELLAAEGRYHRLHAAGFRDVDNQEALLS